MVETIEQNKEEMFQLISGETVSEILTGDKEFEHLRAIYEGLCTIFDKSGEYQEL